MMHDCFGNYYLSWSCIKNVYENTFVGSNFVSDNMTRDNVVFIEKILG